MPRLILTAGAILGLERCRRFLADLDAAAANRAGQAIARHLALLRDSPAIGRPSAGDATKRELVIGFGASGYVALYRYDVDDGAVVVLAVRHQREAGY